MRAPGVRSPLLLLLLKSKATKVKWKDLPTNHKYLLQEWDFHRLVNGLPFPAEEKRISVSNSILLIVDRKT